MAEFVRLGTDQAVNAHAQAHLHTLLFTKLLDWETEVEYRFVLQGHDSAFEFVDFRDALLGAVTGPDYADSVPTASWRGFEREERRRIECSGSTATPILPPYHEHMTQRDDQRLHGLLTAALVSDLAWSSGTVEQADRIGTLARPEMVGRIPGRTSLHTLATPSSSVRRRSIPDSTVATSSRSSEPGTTILPTASAGSSSPWPCPLAGAFRPRKSPRAPDGATKTCGSSR